MFNLKLIAAMLSQWVDETMCYITTGHDYRKNYSNDIYKCILCGRIKVSDKDK